MNSALYKETLVICLLPEAQVQLKQQYEHKSKSSVAPPPNVLKRKKISKNKVLERPSQCSNLNH